MYGIETIKWKFCLVFALLLLLPTRIDSKSDNDSNVSTNWQENKENEKSKEQGKLEQSSPAERRALIAVHTPHALLVSSMRTSPLECYVCAHKSETPFKACMDPTKFGVPIITCNSVEDKCFMSFILNGKNYESIVRGCVSRCPSSPNTTCCEFNCCNNQAYGMPMPVRVVQDSETTTTKRRRRRRKRRRRNSTSAMLMPIELVFLVAILLVL